MYFVIAQGRLSLSPDYLNSDAYKAWKDDIASQDQLFGLPRNNGRPPDVNEIAILIPDLGTDLFALEREKVTVIPADDLADTISVFCARDEDNGNRSVIVATTQLEEIEGGDVEFTVLPVGVWMRLAETEGACIGAFGSPSEAQHHITNGCIALKCNEQHGWQGIAVHGKQVDGEGWDVMQDFLATAPQHASLVPIPDGIVARQYESLYWDDIATPGNRTFGEDGADVIKLVFMKSGGVYVLVEAKDGEHGRKLLGRLFSHDQAKENLTL